MKNAVTYTQIIAKIHKRPRYRLNNGANTGLCCHFGNTVHIIGMTKA